MQGPVQQATDYTDSQKDWEAWQILAAYNKGIKLSAENEKWLKENFGGNLQDLMLTSKSMGVENIIQSGWNADDPEGNKQLIRTAQDELAQYSRIGKTLGKAASVLATGALPEDMTYIGYGILNDVMNNVQARVENGYVTIPSGQNMYEYVISKDPELQQQVEQVNSLMNVVNNIKTENAKQAKLDEEQSLSDAIAAVDNLTATDDQIAMVASQAQLRNIDISKDIYRGQMNFQLNRGMWYEDDGEFWSGGSAAAQEGRNLQLLDGRTSSAYMDYKRELKSTAQNVIDEYTRVAMSRGEDLETYLGKTGTTLDDIMDIAYNRMLSEGVQVLNTPDAAAQIETAVNTTDPTINNWQAVGMGVAHGAATYAESFMNTPYQVYDIATYEARREEIKDEMVRQYGELAPQVYREQLLQYAQSGKLDAESTTALLNNIQNARSIFDVAYDIDPGWLAGTWRDTMESLGKTVDELEANTQYMSETGRTLFNGASMVVNNSAAMLVSTVTGGVAGNLGASATVASAIGTTLGHGLTSWDASYEQYAGKVSDPMAAMLATRSAVATVLMNMGGTTSEMNLYSSNGAAWAGYASALREKGAVGILMEMGKQTGMHAMEEGLEEVAEGLVETGLELTDGIAMALDQGKALTLSGSMKSVADAYLNLDVAETAGELAKSYLGGAAFGALFSAGGIAINAYKGASQVKLENNYSSIELAGKVMRGELLPTEGVVHDFIEKLQIDLQDSKFSTMLDKADKHIRDTKNMAVAALSGVGTEARDAALVESRKADDYEAKAKAAETSVQKNQSQYLKHRTEALKGDIEAAKKLDGYAKAWAEAGTALQEATDAASKCRQTAAKHIESWINQLQVFASGITTQDMKDAAAQILAERNAQAEAIVAAEDAEVMAQAEAESIMEAEPEVSAEPEQVTAEAESNVLEAEIASAETAFNEAMQSGADEETLNAPGSRLAELEAQRDAQSEEAPSEAEEAAYAAAQEKAKYQQELDEMEPVYKSLNQTKLYVDESQRASILARTGLKSLSQVGVKYGIKLTTDRSAADATLDGGYFAELAATAPGWFDGEAGHPEDVLIDLMERKAQIKKALQKDTARARARSVVQANIASTSSADSAIQVQPHHTPQQVQQINDYHNAVDTRLLKAAQTYKNDPSAGNVRTPVSEVSEREAADIKNLTGADVEGYVHTADRNFFTHVEKRHGVNGEADQSMKSLEDVARVGWVIENYDSVELLQNSDGTARLSEAYRDKTDRPDMLVRYKKQLDGSVYVVEAVGESKWKKLWLVSAYVQKNGSTNTSQNQTVTQAPHAGNQPSGNVRNAAASPVNTTVAQNKASVKRGNIQADYVSMDGVTLQPTPTAGTARRNPIQTFNRLAKDMGIGKTFGTKKMNGLEGRAAGYYETRAQYAVTDTKHASSIEVAGHEIGHAIAQKLGMTGTQQMVNNLTARFPANYDAAELPSEAFAEFFWRYLINDKDAENFAGSAYIATMERNLRREGLLDSVRTAQRETRQFLLAEANAEIGLMVRDKSDKNNGDTLSEKLMSAERHFISMMVDSTRAAEDVNNLVRDASGTVSEDENLRHAALMQGHATKRAATVLNDHLTDVNGTVVGESLKQRLADAGLGGKDFNDFVNYMLAKHSLDRDAQGKLVFDRGAITADKTQAFIDDIEKNRPQIQRAAQAFQSFRHDFMMEYMVKTGFMTERTLAMFEAMYPNYVPTYRVKDRGGLGLGRQTYTIMSATGSTEQIINPMDSFVDMVNTIVAMNLRNETYKTFDRVYNRYDGMGIFGREVNQDQRPDANFATTQDEVLDILLRADADDDVIRQVLNTIGRQHVTNDVNLPNVIRVQMEDGSTKFYEIFDQELFNMFEGTPDAGKSGLDVVGHLTKFMTAMTTGSNPVFGIRNAMRDFQNSVNYGSWATTYADGLGKWLSAAWDVFRDGWIGETTGLNANNATYEQYKALGGGGWTRIDTHSKKGAAEYRGELIEGYDRSNIGRTAKWAGKKIWNGLTQARLNEIIEQTSRYAEYKYGKHDLTTVAGRREAFLAAQDVTTDFSRRGNAALARELKALFPFFNASLQALFPFFNASLQGIYRTGRQFTEAEGDRARTRFMKTVINTGLSSALASLAMIKFMDDEDKEEFFYLSDDLKAKHMYLPNFAPDILGEAPLIRIPLNQDPLAYAVHAAVTNAVWSGEGEEWAIELGAVADNILDSLNPVSSMITDPINAMKTNKNWYGSNIVSRSMENMYVTNQYTAETPDLFIAMSRGLDAITLGKKLKEAGYNISPVMLQYVAEQYTGFVGQMVIPFFSKNKFTGEINGIDAVIDDVRKTLVSDPLKSNDVVSAVYDSATLLTSVTAAKGKPMDMLRRGLSQQEARRAYDEAYAMTHKGGIIYDAKKAITAGYAKIDEIEANTTLTDEQKYTLQSEVRRGMIETALDANEAMAEFREKYIDGESFLTRMLKAGVVIE